LLIDNESSGKRKDIKRNKIENCNFFSVNLDKSFPEIIKIENLPKPNVLLLDPPRAGLHPKLLKNLIQLETNKIIYISCNPTTQARDLSQFVENGYNLKKIAMIDMFPHTPHIETVVFITKL